MLNKYPYVVYIWGHNHSEKDPYYGTVKLPGDTIVPLKGIDTLTADGEVAAQEIHFTYIACGVVRGNQISDNEQENSERALYVTVDGSKLTFVYCDRYGEVFDRLTYDVLDATYFEDFYTQDAANAANLTVDITEVTDMSEVQRADFFLDRPVAGNTPSGVTEFSDRYETAIEWLDENGETVTGEFDYGCAYTARLTLTGDVDFSSLTADNVFLFDTEGVTMPTRYLDCVVVYSPEADGSQVIEITFLPTAAQADEPLAAAEALDEGTEYAICSDSEQYLYTVSRADCVAQDGQLLTEPDTTFTWRFTPVDGGYAMCSLYGTYLTAGINGPHVVLTPVSDLADGEYTVWTFSDGALHIDVDGTDYCLTYNDRVFALTEDTANAAALYAVG